MVAALAVSPGHEVRPGDLAEACWGEAVPAHLAEAGAGARVPRASPPRPRSILTTAQGYALGVDPEAIDSVRFERLVAQAREHRANGDPERAISGLRACARALARAAVLRHRRLAARIRRGRTARGDPPGGGGGPARGAPRLR